MQQNAEQKSPRGREQHKRSCCEGEDLKKLSLNFEYFILKCMPKRQVGTCMTGPASAME